MAMTDRSNVDLNASGGAPIPTIDPVGPTVNDGVNETIGINDSEGHNSAMDWFNSMIEGVPSMVLRSHDDDGNNSILSAVLSNGIKTGKITARDAQYIIAQHGIKVTPALESYLSNELSREATNDAYDLEIQSIGDKAKATQQAAIDTGLNYSAYTMSNGMMQGAGIDPANVYKSESAENRVRDRFQAKTGMAKTLIGLASGMASMGIHGASMFAARKAVAGLTTAATRDAAKIRADSYLKGKVKSKYHIKSDGTITGWSNYNY